MGKISRAAGPTHAVPDVLIVRIKEMHTNGASLESLRLQLNEWAVPHADPNSNLLPGSWTSQSVQALLDAEAAS